VSARIEPCSGVNRCRVRPNRGAADAGQFWIRPSELVLLYRFLSVFEAVVCASSIPLRISPRDAGKSNALGTTPMRLNQLPAVTRLAALSAALRPCTPSATVTCYWRGLQRKLGNDSRARMLNVSNTAHRFSPLATRIPVLELEA